jgi:hypothetical protein
MPSRRSRCSSSSCMTGASPFRRVARARVPLGFFGPPRRRHRRRWRANSKAGCYFGKTPALGSASFVSAEKNYSNDSLQAWLSPTIHACSPGGFPATPTQVARRLPH